MGGDECVKWDHKKHLAAATVATICDEFIQKLRAAPDSQVSALRDTKPFHHAFFKQAVPQACPYLAGNFRGSDHSCLKHRNVSMADRTGAKCADVDRLMFDFHAATRVALSVLETRLGRKPVPTPEMLVALVTYIAETVSSFQDIHPYADGNGHIGRLLVWVISGHFGLLPLNWWLHENPGSEWNAAVHDHQCGDPLPLQAFLIRTLA